MLRSEAITIIKRGLGFRQTQDASIIAALQSAQRTIELGKSLPRFLLNTFQFDTVSGTASYSITGVLEDRFIRVQEDALPYYTTTGGAQVKIPVGYYDELYAALVSDSTESDAEVIEDSAPVYPQALTIGNSGTIFLIPTPTVVVEVSVNAYFKALVLDSDIENAWLKYMPDYLIGEAGMIVAMVVRDKDALMSFKAMRDRGFQSHLGAIIDSELQGRQLIMGRDN
jgi:hypothetical protein